MFKKIVFISFFPFIHLFGQEYFSVGSRSNSMANATVALPDCWSYNYNPGSLGVVKNKFVGISYANRFLLKELQNQSLVYVHPLKVGVLSFGFLFHGLDVYKTMRIGVGYSLKLTNKLYAGIQLNYNRFQFSTYYGSKNSMSAEAGIYALITEKWKIGCSVFNIGNSKISTNERLPSIIRLGSVYQLSEKVLFAIEADKNINYKLRLKGAFEYNIHSDFYLRFGIANQPIEFSFGIGYKLKKFQLDLGSSYHQIIGWSPNLSLTYLIK